MQSRVGMWGGSCAVRLPKMAVETLGLCEGESVRLTLEGDALVIRPIRKSVSLNKLVEEARSLSAPEALDDEPEGQEFL